MLTLHDPEIVPAASEGAGPCSPPQSQVASRAHEVDDESLACQESSHWSKLKSCDK